MLYSVSKELPHYKKLWDLAAMEITRLRALHKSLKSEYLSCNDMRGAPPVALEKTPHVEFGSRVLAYILIEKQTKRLRSSTECKRSATAVQHP